MNAPGPRRIAQRRFAWLLWLGLLLPVAQATAACHALAHLRDAPPASQAGGKQALHAAHCDLCLVAAAIAGGAPLGATQAFGHAPTRHAVPQIAVADVWRALPLRTYLSRAPPFALR